MWKPAGKTAWSVVALIILATALYFYTSQNDSYFRREQPRFTQEKTDAGAVADFSPGAYKIHSAVDSALSGLGLQPVDKKEGLRETPRRAVKGIIRWHTRQILINIKPEMTSQAIQDAMENAVQKASGKILNMQPDTYQNLSVLRFDIGFSDTLEGDPVTIIADRLYVVQEKKTVGKLKSSSLKVDMAIVLDDFGNSLERLAMFAAIGRPLTLSVLPHLAYSSEVARRATASGQQVMLHLPMESLSSGEQREKNTIMVTMNDTEIQEIVNKALQSVPGATGVNNHQGSKATADRRVMRDVLAVLKSRNLFFVDSHTNSQSIAAEVSRQMGVRTARNDLFIDNRNDVSSIKDQLRTAAQMASRHGSIVVIGHDRPATVTAIQEMVPELEAAGVRLVFVSQLAN